MGLLKHVSCCTTSVLKHIVSYLNGYDFLKENPTLYLREVYFSVEISNSVVINAKDRLPSNRCKLTLYKTFVRVLHLHYVRENHI